jgi:hypothetical protein
MAQFNQKKVALIEKHREINVHHEWWDSVYETFKEDMNLLGYSVEDITFSGFWSQGDGASFTGRDNEPVQLLMASILPDYADWVYKNHPPSEGYSQEYDQWDAKFVEALGTNIQPFYAVGGETLWQALNVQTTRSSHRYSHHKTVSTEIELNDIEEWLHETINKFDEGDLRRVILEEKFEGAMADFEYFSNQVAEFLEGKMLDLYAELEEFYNYLTSDASVWETIVANELDAEAV